MKSTFLAPSLLSADFSNLATAIEKIEVSGCKYVHLDIMDGRFVPEITYGQTVLRSIRPLTNLQFDVHLMVEKPEEQFESFAEAGADLITFHLESCVHAHRNVEKIHSLGKKAGIAIVPSTPICMLEELLPEIDVALVMSVNPGFGGQKLIPSCIKKVSALDQIRFEKGLSFLISVDGGVNQQNIEQVFFEGADIAVSGSAFFSGALKWESK